MIRRTSALLARLVLVLAVFGMGIPAPALMKCLTGKCPLPCCAEAKAPKPEAKCCKPKAEPVHSCCASKVKAQHEVTSGSDTCQACKCELRSSTPAVAKKFDLILNGGYELPVMDQPEAAVLAVRAPAFVERVIFAGDSSPPIARPYSANRGRAPPVVG